MTNLNISLEQPSKGWLASALTGLRTREGDRKGFTLMELLVVIGIIAILAAIAIPIFLNQQKAAHRSALESDVKNSVSEVMTATGGKPDFTGAPVVETKASGNTVVAANHPVDPAAFMIYGYSEAADAEICFDSSTSAMGEHACYQPNLARVAAESGTPGNGDGDGEEYESGGGGYLDPACFQEGTDFSAYQLGWDFHGWGYLSFEDFESSTMPIEDWGWPASCQPEWERGWSDADAGNPYAPGTPEFDADDNGDGNPGTNPGDDEGTPGDGNGPVDPLAVCFSAGPDSAYSMGHFAYGYGYSGLAEFESLFSTLTDLGISGCDDEFNRGFADAASGNFNPGPLHENGTAVITPPAYFSPPSGNGGGGTTPPEQSDYAYCFSTTWNGQNPYTVGYNAGQNFHYTTVSAWEAANEVTVGGIFTDNRCQSEFHRGWADGETGSWNAN